MHSHLNGSHIIFLVNRKTLLKKKLMCHQSVVLYAMQLVAPKLPVKVLYWLGTIVVLGFIRPLFRVMDQSSSVSAS